MMISPAVSRLATRFTKTRIFPMTVIAPLPAAVFGLRAGSRNLPEPQGRRAAPVYRTVSLEMVGGTMPMCPAGVNGILHINSSVRVVYLFELPARDEKWISRCLRLSDSPLSRKQHRR